MSTNMTMTATVASPYFEELKSTNFLKTYVDAFHEFKVAGELLDVTIVCEDDSIKAHKLVLSACSPFFRRIFMKVNHPHPWLYLNGVQHKDLLSLIDYIYEGETKVAPEDLTGFFKTAKYLEILGLMEYETLVNMEPFMSHTDLSSTEENNNTHINKTSMECNEKPINHKEDLKNTHSFLVKDRLNLPPEMKDASAEDKWRYEISKLIRKFKDPVHKLTMWKCTRCDFKATRAKYKQEIHAENHIKHLDLFSYSCKYCDKKPKTREAFYKHMYEHKMQKKAPLKKEENSADNMND